MVCQDFEIHHSGEDCEQIEFVEVGWNTKIENSCIAKALPTPESEIFNGARADGLPVAPTQLEWCTIRSESK